MNDQTSPTADGQLPDPAPVPARDPMAFGQHEYSPAPLDGHRLDQVPPAGPGVPGGEGTRALVARTARALVPDAVLAGVLAAVGIVVGVLGAMAWYRFSPTVWLSVPASVVGQVTSNIDQYALLVAPEGKGVASVDGYYFVVTAIGGLLLGVAAFLLARRGEDGRMLGGWAGVLFGGFLASLITAALGRWISLPDPITVLHKIAANRQLHATVALHAQGLYVAAPLAGMLVYMGLTLAFTKNPPLEWAAYQQRGEQGYFAQDNPYGVGPTPPAGDGDPARRPSSS